MIDINFALESSHYIMPFFDQKPPPGSWEGGKAKTVDPACFFQADERRYNFSTQTQTVPGQGNVAKILPNAGSADKTFRWLPYIAGMITYLPLSNGPILTGKFTGCWMAIFTMKGVAYLAHIGTDSNSMSNTEDVKNAWKIAKGRGIIREVSAMLPTNEARGGSSFFGAAMPDQSMYAIGCDEPQPGCLKVKVINRVAGIVGPQFE